MTLEAADRRVGESPEEEGSDDPGRDEDRLLLQWEKGRIRDPKTCVGHDKAGTRPRSGVR